MGWSWKRRMGKEKITLTANPKYKTRCPALKWVSRTIQQHVKPPRKVPVKVGFTACLYIAGSPLEELHNHQQPRKFGFWIFTFFFWQRVCCCTLCIEMALNCNFIKNAHVAWQNWIMKSSNPIWTIHAWYSICIQNFEYSYTPSIDKRRKTLAHLWKKKKVQKYCPHCTVFNAPQILHVSEKGDLNAHQIKSCHDWVASKGTAEAWPKPKQFFQLQA